MLKTVAEIGGVEKVLKGRLVLRLALAVSGLIFLWLILGVYLIFYPLGVILKLVDYPPRLAPMPCSDVEEIGLVGPTLFVGDLHLTAGEDSGVRLFALSHFVADGDVENLVIVGDLFDSPGDVDRILVSSGGDEAARAIMDRLGLQGRAVRVFYLKGSPSHDPQDLEIDYEGGVFLFRTVGRCASFSGEGVKMLVVHGDDVFGGLHGLIFSYLAGRPYLEAWWKDLMGVDSGGWVLMAHSHVPGIDYSRRVANTGGWTDVLGFGPPRGTGILVADGDVELVRSK
jgi:hypothetical protein